MQLDLSVIIVNWNTKKLLEDCLDSIYKFSKGISFEVIVVDNASQDGSQQIVKKKFPKVKLIENKDNLGFGKANNQGLKIAKGEYIMLLNSDTYQIENSFEKIVKKARELPNLGAFGPLLLHEDRTIQQSVGFFPHLPQVVWWMSFLDDLPGATFLKPYHVDHDSFYKKQHEVDWVTGAAIVVPKKVFDQLGGFDEAIFMYGEDFEWCFRIKKESYKIYFSPCARIVHIGQGSSNKIPTRAFIGECRGIKYFYQKHKSRASLQIVRALLKIGALARIIIFLAMGRKETAKAYVEVFKVA